MASGMVTSNSLRFARGENPGPRPASRAAPPWRHAQVRNRQWASESNSDEFIGCRGESRETRDVERIVAWRAWWQIPAECTRRRRHVLTTTAQGKEPRARMHAGALPRVVC